MRSTFIDLLCEFMGWAGEITKHSFKKWSLLSEGGKKFSCGVGKVVRFDMNGCSVQEIEDDMETLLDNTANEALGYARYSMRNYGVKNIYRDQSVVACPGDELKPNLTNEDAIVDLENNIELT